MSSTESFKRNILSLWGTDALVVLTGFFLTRYTLDVIGVSSYESWLLVNSIISYLSLLYLGFGETISRYVAKYHTEENWTRLNQVVSVILAAYLVMGAIAFLIACGLSVTAPWWGGWKDQDLFEVRITILILGMNVAVGMVGSVFGGVLYGLRRFDLERLVGVIFELLRVALFVFLLRKQYGLVIISGIYFLVAVGENVLYVLLARKVLPTLAVGFSYLDRSVLREWGSFGSMAFCSTIASRMINATDTITIGLLLGKEAIVPYYFGLRLAQFTKQPIDKIAHVCMPTVGALRAGLDQTKRERFLIKTLGLVFLLVGGAFIGHWYFGADAIRLWVGSKVSSDSVMMSHRVLVILAVAQLIAVPCGILRAFLFGSGIVKVPALIFLFEAIFNLSLSLILCTTHGIEGVAWGTTIPVILVELGVLMPYALKQLQVSGWRIAKGALQPQLLPLVLLLFFAQFVSQQTWSHGDWRVLVAVALIAAGILSVPHWLRERFGFRGAFPEPHEALKT